MAQDVIQHSIPTTTCYIIYQIRTCFASNELPVLLRSELAQLVSWAPVMIYSTMVKSVKKRVMHRSWLQNKSIYGIA